jgi:hypothetical protein
VALTEQLQETQDADHHGQVAFLRVFFELFSRDGLVRVILIRLLSVVLVQVDAHQVIVNLLLVVFFLLAVLGQFSSILQGSQLNLAALL